MPFLCALLALLLLAHPEDPPPPSRGEPVPGWAPVALGPGKAGEVEVEVVVHVITGDAAAPTTDRVAPGGTAADQGRVLAAPGAVAAGPPGSLSDAVIREQLAVLNRAFAGTESPDAADTGFTFRLRSTHRLRDLRWFTHAHQPATAREMKAATRVGGPDVLNVWTVDLPRLGYATLPSAYADAPELDGVVIDHASVPGGTAPHAGLGKTLVHEAGHWLGLWHTFENGCTALNDEVADTPAQSGPSAGCPQGRDSCSRPGQDPVHNYMDYSSDACYNQFTEGQAERMRAAWTTFREKS